MRRSLAQAWPWPPSPAYRQLRALVERLQALKDMHQQECNRLEAHHASGEVTVLPNVKSHIAWLDEQTTQLQRTINDHIDGHPERWPKSWRMQAMSDGLPTPRRWLPLSAYARVSGSLGVQSGAAR